jgi:hypothetical protein
MSWHPTPKRSLITAKRLTGGGAWVDCEYKDLKKGDVFKAFYQGEQIEPVSLAPVDRDDHVGVCVSDAFRNDAFDQGYTVEIDFGPLDEVMKLRAS